MYFILEPECCGTFGRKSLYKGELTDNPPQIMRLHYEFSSFPTGELVSVSSIYIGTESLAETIRSVTPRPTGISFDEVTITNTFEFRQNNPNRELPPFKWFKISGTAGKDAFGMSKDHRLVVSEPILRLLHQRLGKCPVSQFAAG